MELSQTTMNVFVNESNLMAASQGMAFLGYNVRFSKEFCFKLTVNISMISDLTENPVYHEDSKVYKVYIKEAKTN